MPEGELNMEMNELMLFENEQFKHVRCLMIDDEPWFVAGDIYRHFGLSNPRAVISRLDPDEKGVNKVYTAGGYQSMTMVNESGLYHLLFLISPKRARGKGSVTEDDVQKRLEEVKQFRRWVTSEILPSIRKHGAYVSPVTIDSIIADPEYGIRLLQALKDERNNNDELKNKLVDAEAKATEYKAEIDEFKNLVEDGHLYGIREAARIMDISQSQLTNWLFENGYTERDEKNMLVPTIKAADRGLLKLSVYRPHFSDKLERRSSRITSKGLMTFIKELRATGKDKTNLRKVQYGGRGKKVAVG